MKQRLAINITPSLSQALRCRNASETISRAITEAGRNPELLVAAFRERLTQPQENNSIRLCFTHEVEVKSYMERLSRMTKLPIEQVVRLSIEAYIRSLNQPKESTDETTGGLLTT